MAVQNFACAGGGVCGAGGRGPRQWILTDGFPGNAGAATHGVRRSHNRALRTARQPHPHQLLMSAMMSSPCHRQVVVVLSVLLFYTRLTLACGTCIPEGRVCGIFSCYLRHFYCLGKYKVRSATSLGFVSAAILAGSALALTLGECGPSKECADGQNCIQT